MMGLLKRFQKKPIDAMSFYEAADKVYIEASDKVRVTMHKIDMLLDQGKKDQAIIQCKAALHEYKGNPSSLVIKSKLNILSPPPPPPAQPNKKIPAQ